MLAMPHQFGECRRGLAPMPSTHPVAAGAVCPPPPPRAAPAHHTRACAAQWVGSFDFDALEFSSDGTVYHFPRDVHCDVSGLGPVAACAWS
jgi:hypothetical protein